MSDRLVKFMAHADMARIICIDSTELVESARITHRLNPTPTAALGRTLTMTAIMASMLKNKEDKITVQILGNGSLGSILCVGNSLAKVKGYVSNAMAEAPEKANGKLNVSAIVGKGDLRIIKDIGLKEPYIGTVPLQTGEIAEDFAYYYAVSEQIPTAVALGVLLNKDGSVKRAGGYIIQLLPDTPDEIATLIENRLMESSSITELLEKNLSLEEIAEYISDDLNTVKVEEMLPKFECDCSKDRVEKALIAIGKSDLEELSKDSVTELECHFCNRKYKFTSEEIKKLILG